MPRKNPAKNQTQPAAHGLVIRIRWMELGHELPKVGLFAGNILTNKGRVAFHGSTKHLSVGLRQGTDGQLTGA